MKRIVNFCFFLALATGPATASDALREARFAEQIVDSLVVGEERWLEADKTRFLALETAPSGEPVRGAIILLHGMGIHPDWPEVIAPLRTGLPEHGWTTLSIQLPIAGDGATREAYEPLIDAAPARIQAALDHLAGAGQTHIVLIGHSLGATMGARYLAERPDTPVKGFVAIGLPGGDPKSEASGSASLAKVKIPVLDLYGSEDLPAVLGTRTDRAAAARRAENKDYVQVEVPGADHMFLSMDETLLGRVRAWLAAGFDNQE